MNNNSEKINLADHSLDMESKEDELKIPDWRHISNGRIIPTKFYSDQPFIIKTDDNAWLCTVTTGSGHEGQAGQHVVSMRSCDQGKTWSEPVDVEPGTGPEASYSVLLKTPYGRIFCFYNHNTDNLREIKADNPPYPDGLCNRVDSVGYYVFKYSDDNGESWSQKRYNVPAREFEIDRKNAYAGKTRFFWNVGKPFVCDGAAYVSLYKVGGIGYDFFTSSEGVLLKSDNILTERDPEKIRWETLPDGDIGLRTPPGGGPVAEEHSYVLLSDNSLYAVYRSIDRHPVCSYSRDKGHTWSEPRYKCYSNGKPMKHPRAANFVWKCSNGKYLYWFHNHGGNGYPDRNPVWICGGIEADSDEGKIILWSQPEIMLYDDDTYIRMSYPDLIEENGKIYITETQKNIARVHEIPNAFLEKLWEQVKHPPETHKGLLFELKDDDCKNTARIDMPVLPCFLEVDSKTSGYPTKDLRTGFTLELWLKCNKIESGTIVIDSRMENGQGLCLQTGKNGCVEIVLNDGRTENRWGSDPEVVKEGKLHHIAVIVDGGPKTITFIIDGILCDGCSFRQFGWGRFSPNLRHANGLECATVGQKDVVDIKRLRIYDRAIMTSEAIGNHMAGVQ